MPLHADLVQRREIVYDNSKEVYLLFSMLSPTPFWLLGWPWFMKKFSLRFLSKNLASLPIFSRLWFLVHPLHWAFSIHSQLLHGQFCTSLHYQENVKLMFAQYKKRNDKNPIVLTSFVFFWVVLPKSQQVHVTVSKTVFVNERKKSAGAALGFSPIK